MSATMVGRVFRMPCVRWFFDPASAILSPVRASWIAVAKSKPHMEARAPPKLCPVMVMLLIFLPLCGDDGQQQQQQHVLMTVSTWDEQVVGALSD